MIAEPGEQREAEEAVRGGAEDRITRGEIPGQHGAAAPASRRRTAPPPPAAARLEIVDEATGLPNLRGFAPIAEHHLRMADRTAEPVVFLFVRLADLGDVTDAAAVLRQAVRDADVPARVAEDTFSVLLTGERARARRPRCCPG